MRVSLMTTGFGVRPVTGGCLADVPADGLDPRRFRSLADSGRHAREDFVRSARAGATR
ncbi:hypothetical protein ACQPYE_37630 [Actinosynnema sp. CA-299493]